MDKKLDAKIKQILQENDDIVVPRNISKGIDETLKSLSNKKTINKKKEQEKIDTEIRKIMNQYLTVKI